jgi:hypothetical protein
MLLVYFTLMTSDSIVYKQTNNEFIGANIIIAMCKFMQDYILPS